jgi:hypothetical protein
MHGTFRERSLATGTVSGHPRVEGGKGRMFDCQQVFWENVMKGPCATSIEPPRGSRGVPPQGGPSDPLISKRALIMETR